MPHHVTLPARTTPRRRLAASATPSQQTLCLTISHHTALHYTASKYYIKASSGSIRRALAKLERGVCVMCKLDCKRLVQQLQCIQYGSKVWDVFNALQLQSPNFGTAAMLPAQIQGMDSWYGKAQRCGQACAFLDIHGLVGCSWQMDVTATQHRK